jgi:hypothetical protein
MTTTTTTTTTTTMVRLADIKTRIMDRMPVTSCESARPFIPPRSDMGQ